MIGPGGDPVPTDLARTLAEHEGVCVRPLLRRVTDRATGETTTVPLACGSTRERVCPPCAGRARRLRMHQCQEGWHLDHNPEPAAARDGGDQVNVDDGMMAGARSGATGQGECEDLDEGPARRVRSTRRLSDAGGLPGVPMDPRTTGRTFTGRDGTVYRPSMFLTLTLPSYGRIVRGVGVPVNPGTYDYRRAALDALHFPKLVDRFWSTLRRCAGYKVQYFAALEAQRRLAAHLHAALRGAIPRATLRAVVAGTYVQVWWPSVDEVVYGDGDAQPVWDADGRRYVDPTTRVPLRSWREALDDLDDDPDARPHHTLRFGDQVDIQGLLGGTRDSDRAVRYLCKYLTKAVADTYVDPAADPAASRSYQAHVDRLHAWVRILPCSPRCANWLRYGVEPDDPGPGLIPGACASPGHDRENLGLGGRRVLVSRQWSGKTLTTHRADRADVVREVLHEAGIEPPEANRCAADVLATDGLPRFVWEDVPVAERDYAEVVLRTVKQARAWRAEYEHAKTLTGAVASGDGGPGARGRPWRAVDSRSATATPRGGFP